MDITTGTIGEFNIFETRHHEHWAPLKLREIAPSLASIKQTMVYCLFRLLQMVEWLELKLLSKTFWV